MCNRDVFLGPEDTNEGGRHAISVLRRRRTLNLCAPRDGSAGALFDGLPQALSEMGYATITARRYLRAAGALHPLERSEPPAGSADERGVSGEIALSTYLGHSTVAHKYWYLEAVPDLMRDIGTGLRAWNGASRPSTSSSTISVGDRSHRGSPHGARRAAHRKLRRRTRIANPSAGCAASGASTR
jgi:hypothetical protein